MATDQCRHVLERVMFMPVFTRKRNRLKGFDYASNNAYFITFCIQNKRCLLRNPYTFEYTDFGNAVLTAINSIERLHHGIRIEKYIVMPNHVHLLLILNQSDVNLSVVIQQLKRSVSIQTQSSFWQKSFHDHVIRSQADYQKNWEYIDGNPAKWKEDCFYVDE